MSEYLNSTEEQLSQSHFYRMLALGCFNIFIILPVSTILLASDIIDEGTQFAFYQGWSAIHSNWEPVLGTKSSWSTDKWSVFIVHWNEWINPFFALVFFALFGLTTEANEGYRRLFRFLCRPFGAKKSTSVGEPFPEVVFKTGMGSIVTVMSNTISRWVSSVLYS